MWKLIVIAALVGGAFSNEEHKLMKSLLSKYPCTHVRPVANHTQKVNVEFGVVLINIEDFDKDDGVLKANVWYMHQWFDNFLKWKPCQHGGITAMRLPADKVWKPDITLYGAIEEEIEDTLVVVDSKGGVIWVPRVQLKLQCKQIAKPKAPTTVQCKFKYGSWVYDAAMVDVLFYDGKPAFDLNEMVEKGRYKKLKAPGKKNKKKYPCCPETYTTLDYVLEFQVK